MTHMKRLCLFALVLGASYSEMSSAAILGSRQSSVTSEALGDHERIVVTREFEKVYAEYELSIQKLQDVMKQAGAVCREAVEQKKQPLFVGVSQESREVLSKFSKLIDVVVVSPVREEVKIHELGILLDRVRDVNAMLDNEENKKIVKSCFGDLHSVGAMSLYQDMISVVLQMAQLCFRAIPSEHSKKIYGDVEKSLLLVANSSANLSDFKRVKTAFSVMSKRKNEGVQEIVAYVKSLDIDQSLVELINQLVSLTFEVQYAKSVFEVFDKIKDVDFYKNNPKNQEIISEILNKLDESFLGTSDSLNSLLLKILHNNKITRVTVDDLKMVFKKIHNMGDEKLYQEAQEVFQDKDKSYEQGYLQGLLLVNPAAVELLDESEVAKLLELLQQVDAQMPTAGI